MKKENIKRYSCYDDLAWLYDGSLASLYTYNFEVLKRELLATMPAKAKVLDLFCGTGQIAMLLTSHGCAVTGLDGSSAMLRHATHNAPQAKFVLADGRDFCFSEKFDGACCTCAGLNHASTIEDLKAIFCCVSKCLKPGSVFVFDINSPLSMSMSWRGRPILGEINRDHAWCATTYYDSETKIGSFKIDIYRGCSESGSNHLPIAKRIIGRLISYPWLAKLKLAILQKFHLFHFDWAHTELSYAVYGHEPSDVVLALKESGFSEVCLQSISGEDYCRNGDDVYFVCTKGSDTD